MNRQAWYGKEHSLARTGMALLVFLWAGSGIGRAEDVPLAASRQQLFDRINEERADQELKPLDRRKELDAAAQAHAENMAAQNSLSHELDDKNPADRAKAAGYPTRIVGETIAWQSELDPEKTVAQWMDSKIHHDILLGDYDDAGVGLAHRPGGVYFWTVVVGRRKIARGAESLEYKVLIHTSHRQPLSP
jgi:uncharacterized protein YkwD